MGREKELEFRIKEFKKMNKALRTSISILLIGVAKEHNLNLIKYDLEDKENNCILGMETPKGIYRTLSNNELLNKVGCESLGRKEYIKHIECCECEHEHGIVHPSFSEMLESIFK